MQNNVLLLYFISTAVVLYSLIGQLYSFSGFHVSRYVIGFIKSCDNCHPLLSSTTYCHPDIYLTFISYIIITSYLVKTNVCIYVITLYLSSFSCVSCISFV